jgi:hypothetical protein
LAVGYLVFGVAIALPAIVYGPTILPPLAVAEPNFIVAMGNLAFLGNHALYAYVYEQHAATFPIEVVEAVALMT